MNARSSSRVPDFTIDDWRRLAMACPFPYYGYMPFGDFLWCGRVSQTQWRGAVNTPDDYIIGVRHFRYIKKHDLLVRGDFYRWATRHWFTVLAREGESGENTKG